MGLKNICGACKHHILKPSIPLCLGWLQPSVSITMSLWVPHTRTLGHIRSFCLKYDSCKYHKALPSITNHWIDGVNQWYMWCLEGIVLDFHRVHGTEKYVWHLQTSLPIAKYHLVLCTTIHYYYVLLYRICNICWTILQVHLFILRCSKYHFELNSFYPKSPLKWGFRANVAIYLRDMEH